MITSGARVLLAQGQFRPKPALQLFVTEVFPKVEPVLATDRTYPVAEIVGTVRTLIGNPTRGFNGGLGGRVPPCECTSTSDTHNHSSHLKNANGNFTSVSIFTIVLLFMISSASFISRCEDRSK